MKKRVFLLILCLLTLAVSICLFAGCSGKNDRPGSNTETPSGDENQSGGEETPITYTVTFMADGVVVETVEFTAKTERITPPSVPNKIGYTGAWENYTLGTESITVNAVYTPITYTATFKADGVTVGTVDFTEGMKDIPIPEVPKKEGYTEKWESFSLTDKNITVNALYTPITYTATFKADGVTVETVEFTVETDEITPPSVPDKTGYTGVWESYTLGMENITVNAIYSTITYTATFVADGVTVGTRDFTVETQWINPPSIPDKTGYVGIWENYTLIADDITVNAIYTIGEYYVIFVADGIEQGRVAFTYGDTEIAEPNVPFKQCHTGEWESYTLGAENITVNAVYTPAHAALINIERNEPTCSAEGNIEHWFCSDCGKRYSNSSCVTEITLVFTIIPKIPHDWSIEIRIIGCNIDEVYTVHYCFYCKEITLIDLDITLHPHSFVLRDSVEPTCTTPGVDTWFECELCGFDVVKDYIPAYGHDYVWTVDKEPTCTVDGSRTGVCQRCGDVYVQPLKAKHSWNVGVITLKPTCEQTGLREHTCLKCGDTKTEIVLALGHYWVNGVVISEPTCTEAGGIRYTCLRCSETKVDVIEALGHNWDSGTVIKEPTCTEAGEILYTCLRCSETDTVSLIPRHIWGEWVILLDATCTTEGVRKRTCTRCGEVDFELIEPYHVWGEPFIIEPATCTEDGEARFICTRCTATKTETVPALGHDYQYQTLREVTCEQDGIVIKYCSRCDYNELIYIPGGHLLEWEYTDTEHWEMCTRGECTYTTEKEQHSLGLEVSVTKTNDGFKHTLSEVCADGCGYKKHLGTSSVHIHLEYEIIDGVKPLCGTPGLTPGLKCASCGLILVEQVEIPATGEHNWKHGNCTVCYETQLKMTLSADGTYYIVSGIGDCTDETVEILPTYKGKPVITIGDFAFNGCDSLTSATIGSGVTSIGDAAFQGCIGLTSITIPNSVTSIGGNAFSGCTGLMNIWIGSGLKNIGFYFTFSGCSSLTSITVSSENTEFKSIDGNLYSKDGKVLIQYAIGKTNTSFNIPEDVKIINVAAFMGCKNLTIVTMENGVTSIGDHAFEFCTGLTSITIPDSVTSIGSYAFSNCTSLTSITFADTSTWYRTTSSSYIGGTETAVTDASTNATYFKSQYSNYYWYKL